MKIHQLYLKNFRGFEEKTLLFQQQLTVLIGDNASGKTAILDALSYSLSTFFLGIDEYYSKTILKKDIHLKSYTDNMEPQLPVIITAKGAIGQREMQWSRDLLRLKGKTRSTEAKELVGYAETVQRKVRENEDIKLPLFSYYGTGRLWKEKNQKINLKGKSSRLDGYRDCLETISHSKIFSGWIKTREISSLQKKHEEDTLLAAVKSAIVSFLESTEKVYYDVLEDTLMMEKNENGIITTLPWTVLSDGYRNIIALIADLAYRCVTLNPHLKAKAVSETEGVVLIDELDLHLHPKWQKKIISDLKKTFPNLQFIVTTHSPFIVQSATADEIINLDGTQLAADPNKRTLEENALYMGVESMRSQSFDEKQQTAEKFYNILETSNAGEINSELENVIEKFSDDPAFVAKMKFEKLAKIGTE